MYYLYNIDQIENDIRKMSNKNEVFIYPAGDMTKVFLEVIDLKLINIIGIIDKKKKKLLDYTVFTVDVLQKFKSASIIITSREYEIQIREDISKVEDYNGEIITGFLDDETDLIDENIKENNRLVLQRMDLVLTTKCSLRCEKCANLMQYYKIGKDVPINIIYESMSRLLSVVDFIGVVYVLGGEPLLYKQIRAVLKFLKKYNNIGRIEIVTNGTIPIRDKKTWEELHDSKVMLSISNYGYLSRYKEELITMCKTYHINYNYIADNWFYDTGNMKKRNRSQKELKKVFQNCETKCRSLYRGELHYCPRSAHGIDLGLVPRKKKDYIDLLQKTENIELKECLLKFIERTDYIETCDYCDIRVGDYYEKKYPAGTQAEHVLEI